jgi:hypothetical protein
MPINTELFESLYGNTKKSLEKSLTEGPAYYTPIVTQNDFDRGILSRYFTRQVNDLYYITEVDEKQYNLFKNNPRFIVTRVEWKIRGTRETVKLKNGTNIFGVEDMNRILVADTDLTFGGLRNYISDYIQFWVAET